VVNVTSQPARITSAEDRIAQKLHDVRLPVISGHGSADRHHQRNSRIDLLLRLLIAAEN
jgi:hypothetical protein